MKKENWREIMIKIYNTLSKKNEELVPLEEGKVSMYVCGPTVYNYIHIGNARPMIVFDSFRRFLEYKGYDVNYVSNFTDVDDKIIKKANEDGITSEEVAKFFIEACKKDMKSLNVKEATTHPLATKEIDGMIETIQILMDKGYAYEKNGTVYFRTRLFEEYGKLSHKNLDDLQSGNRTLLVSGESEKEDTNDFVLWKPKKENEPYWESPWGKGRPGWHIECSVMAKKYIGDSIDIHAGGEDLIFPHHENEIAQSEAANGVEFAKYWMHNAFLNIDNKKMSKSLGNFLLVHEITKQFDPQVLRFFMLSAHYRSQLNFSEELMQAAKNSFERIKTAIMRIDNLLPHLKEAELNADEKQAIFDIDKLKFSYEEALSDDFNTADAISFIFEIVKISNIFVNENASKAFAERVKDTIISLCDILGLTVEDVEEDLAPEIERLIEERTNAKKNRDFSRADEIRDLLLSKGIVLEDTRQGVTWKKI